MICRPAGWPSLLLCSLGGLLGPSRPVACASSAAAGQLASASPDSAAAVSTQPASSLPRVNTGPSSFAAAPAPAPAAAAESAAAALPAPAGALPTPARLAAALGQRVPPSAVPVTTLLSQTVQVQASNAAIALGLWGDAASLLAGTERDLPQIADLILSRQAEAQRALGHWDTAQQLWRRAAAHGSSPLVHARALYGIADADFAGDRWDEAKQGYQLALAQPEAREQRGAARYNLAQIALWRGDLATAARALTELAFRGRDGDLAARAETALRALTAAAPQVGRTWAPRLERLDRLIRQRNFAVAAADLTAMAGQASGPDEHLQLEVRLAQLTLRQGNAHAAVPMFEALLRRRRGPEALAAMRDLAQALAADGQSPRALARLLQAAKQEARTQPGRDAWLRAVQMAMEAGDHPWAYKQASAFLKRFPRDRLGEDMRWLQSWSAYRQGDMPRARQALAQAEPLAARGPGRDRLRYWRGRVAMSLGKQAEAREMWAPLARTPALYYGMWAQAWLAELRTPAAPRARRELMLVAQDSRTPAPTPDTTGVGAVAAAPAPARSGVLPAVLLSHLAHGDEEVDPQVDFALERLQLHGVQAERLEALVLVQARDELARLVLSLQPRAGRSGREVTLARAQLASLAGSPTTAYRLVSLAFADVLAAGPRPEVRGLFSLAYPQVAAAAVQRAAAERHISPAMIWAVMRQESSFDVAAHSPADARGLMQIIPTTGRRIAHAVGHASFEDDHLMRPDVSVSYGGWYLAQLLSRYGGNPALAAAAYNAGPQAVDGWLRQRAPLASDAFIEDIPYRETRLYVKNVVANWASYHGIYLPGSLGIPAFVARVPRGGHRGVDF